MFSPVIIKLIQSGDYMESPLQNAIKMQRNFLFQVKKTLTLGLAMIK